ncbi:MAG: helix-turn-helix domain-containing protein [Proteobacteria bacterium]|nr:helix-turn-helix domain-containing protein [Pseudomonadota bacterium]
MELFGDRLRQRRKKRGLSQQQLADRSGIGQSFLSKLESHKAQATTEILALAAALECTPQWLRSGEGPEEGIPGESNVKDVHSKGGVPVISWVKAGNWADIEDAFLAEDAESWVDVYRGSVGKHAFALRVEGDSMTSPIPGDRLSFPEGTILIVDPDREAKPGDFVIAKDVITQQATFKRLMYDAGRWFLRPLNPAYQTQEIDDPGVRVIGRVMEFQINHKL